MEKKHNGEDSESHSSSDYSSNEEEARRRRRRKEKRKRRHEEKRRHRKKRKYSDDEDESDGKRKKRRRSDSHSSDEDSSSESESDRKRRSKDKRKKRRHHRHSDDESGSDREQSKKKKKLLKEAKKILKNAAKQSSQGAETNLLSFRWSWYLQRQTISEDDYYLKSNEFATWLKDYHRLYFSDMSAEETRKLFVTFVDAWNSGGLPDKYYEGIKTGPRSGHKWNFQDNQVDEEEERLRKRKKEKGELKKFQKEHEVVMDEMLPKATGKERLFEKRAIQREKNRNREPSPEPMRESDIMGGGDDFKSMLARERARREKRVNQKADALQKKLAVVEEKETAAMDHLRSLVNTAGGKIVIPKRV